LQKLQKEYPNKKLVGFFYDPNIHPYSEYYLRLLDVKRSCRMLKIELIEGEYDTQNWLKAIEGLEREPEKGARCAVCFDRRFEVSAKKARELNEKCFTSTLLTSPKKSLKQLKVVGDIFAKKYGIEFLAPDFRKASGTQEQNLMAKQDKLYRQDYCGCMFALLMQREQQQRLADELFVPISKQIQPESIEARVELYKKRVEFEERKIEYKIVKERFLNWRIEFGQLKIKKETITSHFLPYSTLKGEYSRGRVEYSIENLYYMNRNEIKFITLKRYNTLADRKYNSVEDLIFNPPPFEVELKVRRELIANPYDLSAILVVKEIPSKKVEILLRSHIYEDVKEMLTPLSY
jgi:predicted adenine nucleotide alpha hydrolase (AANH) superfamily ATPase